MTTATATLRKEHEAILKVLEAAEEVSRQLDRGVHVAAGTLSSLLEFLRLFADRCHHGKEEEHLFPVLEQKGLPRNGGPIGVMLSEHEQGRALIRQMKEACRDYAADQSGAGQTWAAAARGYSRLLRGHIMKENNILFAMADEMLSDAEQEALAEAFEKVEDEKMGPGTHERLHALMDRLRAEIFTEFKAAV